MIDKINTTQLQEILANAASKQKRTAAPEQEQSADASLQADYASLIKRISADSGSNGTRLQQVKELLDKGLLDTPDNCRQAAQKIVRYGI